MYRTGGSFAPTSLRDSWQGLETFLFTKIGGEVDTGLQWVETRDAVNYLKIPRMAPWEKKKSSRLKHCSALLSNPRIEVKTYHSFQCFQILAWLKFSWAFSPQSTPFLSPFPLKNIHCGKKGKSYNQYLLLLENVICETKKVKNNFKIREWSCCCGVVGQSPGCSTSNLTALIQVGSSASLLMAWECRMAQALKSSSGRELPPYSSGVY